MSLEIIDFLGVNLSQWSFSHNFSFELSSHSAASHIPKSYNSKNWGVIVKRNNRAFLWQHIEPNFYGHMRDIINQQNGKQQIPLHLTLNTSHSNRCVKNNSTSEGLFADSSRCYYAECKPLLNTGKGIELSIYMYSFFSSFLGGW